jgi:uncharacterized membrane protein
MRDFMLILHFLGLILGMGAGFTNLFIASSNKNMDREEASKFFLKLRVTGYLGLTGIILLILSGGYLMTPYWTSLGSMPLLITKLILVGILLILIIMMDIRWRKAVKNGGGPDLAALPKLGRFALPIGLAIVILAVSVFH